MMILGITVSTVRQAAMARYATCFGAWLVISPTDPASVVAGVFAAAAAAWTSLRLLPPGGLRPNGRAVAGLAVRLVRQSAVAGVDVAWRAVQIVPRLDLTIVAYRQRLRAGTSRLAFGAYASLMPGTLPCGLNDDGTLAVHCLDAAMPVLADLAADEAMVGRAIGAPHE